MRKLRSNIKIITLCGFYAILETRQCTSLSPTTTPNSALKRNIDDSSYQIHHLARKSSARRRGSKSYQKAWRHWLQLSTDAIRTELSNILPHPVDQDELHELSFSLGVAADVGEMPSFENAGARSGYALDYFCRARLLADIFIDLDSPMSGYLKEECKVTSIGGGPGFDFVAAALVSVFNGAGVSEDIVPIQARILDYESGWSTLVKAMNDATKKVLSIEDKMHCAWAGKCDITKSIYDKSNVNCLAVVDSTSYWTCQYCVAENAGKLKDSDYIFFRELFEAAAIGAMFFITETTPRLWPEIYDLIVQYNEDHDQTILKIHFPYMRGQQMIISKSCISDDSNLQFISERDTKLLHNFKRYAQSHEELIESGWERQRKKTIPLI